MMIETDLRFDDVDSLHEEGIVVNTTDFARRESTDYVVTYSARVHSRESMERTISYRFNTFMTKRFTIEKMPRSTVYNFPLPRNHLYLVSERECQVKIIECISGDIRYYKMSPGVVYHMEKGIYLLSLERQSPSFFRLFIMEGYEIDYMSSLSRCFLKVVDGNRSHIIEMWSPRDYGGEEPVLRRSINDGSD
jgi:hypothetical protein